MEDCPGLPLPKGRRKKKLTEKDKHYITCLFASGKVHYTRQATSILREGCGIDVSHDTITRALKEAQFILVRKVKKPRLTPHHKKARKQFTERYENWSKADWRCVIFSDETTITRFGAKKGQLVWRKPGNALRKENVQGTVKFGRGSLILWGCMTSDGVGFACKIEGKMDSDLYILILGDELLGTFDYYGRDKEDAIFQHDNAPIHTAKKVKEWLTENDLRVLEWPAQSPDLNPIENLWAYLKRRLESYETDPDGMVELWERVEKEWNDIPQDLCKSLIEGMPKHICAILKVKGGYTRY